MLCTKIKEEENKYFFVLQGLLNVLFLCAYIELLFVQFMCTLYDEVFMFDPFSLNRFMVVFDADICISI